MMDKSHETGEAKCTEHQSYQFPGFSIRYLSGTHKTGIQFDKFTGTWSSPHIGMRVRQYIEHE